MSKTKISKQDKLAQLNTLRSFAFTYSMVKEIAEPSAVEGVRLLLQSCAERSLEMGIKRSEINEVLEGFNLE